MDQEGLPYEAAALTLLGHAAAGSMRDSLSLLDQAIAYGSGKVEEVGVRAMLGAIDQTSAAYPEALANNDGNALLAEADRMAERSIGFEAALRDPASLIHRIAWRKSPGGNCGNGGCSCLTDLAARFSARRSTAVLPDSVAWPARLALAR